MNTEELAAPCGLYCGSCKVYLTKSCNGCKAKRDEKCPIWKCAEERHSRFCGECIHFPCEKNYMVPAISKQWLDEIKATFKSKKRKKLKKELGANLAKE